MAAKDLEHHKENPNSLSINEILVEQKFAEICMVSEYEDKSDSEPENKDELDSSLDYDFCREKSYKSL